VSKRKAYVSVKALIAMVKCGFNEYDGRDVAVEERQRARLRSLPLLLPRH
jgi:hypothetical protein